MPLTVALISAAAAAGVVGWGDGRGENATGEAALESVGVGDTDEVGADEDEQATIATLSKGTKPNPNAPQRVTWSASALLRGWRQCRSPYD